MNIARSGVLLLALAAAGTAFAAEPTGSAYTEVTVAGIKVGVDARTGRLRPLTVDESAALDRALVSRARQARPSALQRQVAPPTSAAEARLTRRALAHGGAAAKLPLSEMNAVTASIGADGKVTIRHQGDAPTAASGHEVAGE